MPVLRVQRRVQHAVVCCQTTRRRVGLDRYDAPVRPCAQVVRAGCHCRRQPSLQDGPTTLPPGATAALRGNTECSTCYTAVFPCQRSMGAAKQHRDATIGNLEVEQARSEADKGDLALAPFLQWAMLWALQLALSIILGILCNSNST